MCNSAAHSKVTDSGRVSEVRAVWHYAQQWRRDDMGQDRCTKSSSGYGLVAARSAVYQHARANGEVKTCIRSQTGYVPRTSLIRLASRASGLPTQELGVSGVGSATIPHGPSPCQDPGGSRKDNVNRQRSPVTQRTAMPRLLPGYSVPGIDAP